MKTAALHLAWTAAVVLALPARAQDPAFDKANALYRAGRFAEAASSYGQLADERPRDASLLFNLGNARFKSGALGAAIASYLAAFRIHPRDADLQYNLDFALRKAGDQLYPDGVPRGLWQAFYGFSLAELEGAAWLLWWLAGLAGAAALLDPRTRPGLAPTAGLALAAALALGGWWAVRRSLEPERLGVTVQARAELRNGPGETFTVGFTLPEGRRVSILGASGDWLEVGVLKEAAKGWLPAASVEEVR